MVNVFGASTASGPGNLQVMKKVGATEGKFEGYIDEIQQSYDLGFSPYRLHKNTDGTFVTPIRYYDGRVYVLDDVATMEVVDRSLTEDTVSSKLIYLVKGDGGSGVALQGYRGPSGARCLKGDSGDEGPVGSRGPTGKRGAEEPEGPPGKIGKMGPVGSEGEIIARGEKGDKGDTGGVGQQGHIVPRGSTGPRGVQGAKGLRGIASPLGVQGPAGSTGEEGERGPKEHYGTQGLVGDKGERGERDAKGETGIQGDNSDVLSVLVNHLPIQLTIRYGEKCALSSTMYQRTSRVL